MNTALRMFGMAALLLGMFVTQSCSPAGATYQVDTVRFVDSNPAAVNPGPAPMLWINTNTKLKGFWGGSVKSSKPYGIQFDYTDNSFSLTMLEFTSATLTYDDGEREPRVEALDLPLRTPARKYQAINSVNGGGTVTTTVRILSGQMPALITRDEPFTLHLEGQFTRDDGSRIPFTIEKHYDVEIESTTKPAAEVLQD